MRKLFFRKCLMVFKLDLNLSASAEGSSYNKNFNSCLTYTCNNCLHIDTQSFHRGGSRGRVQEVHTLPPPKMSCGFLIQLVFCKKTMYLIGVEIKHETRLNEELMLNAINMVFCHVISPVSYAIP